MTKCSSQWPRGEGGSNTSRLYCRQLKFTLFFRFLRERLKLKGYSVWHLAIIFYLFFPYPAFSLPTETFRRVNESLAVGRDGNGRWATNKGHAKLECVHLSRDDRGLISAACCRGKEGGCCRYSFDICVWHLNDPLLSCIVCCLFQGLDNWGLWIYVGGAVDAFLWLSNLRHDWFPLQPGLVSYEV